MVCENNLDNLRQFLDREFTFKRFALFLALLIVLCFPTVVTLQATFMHRDYSVFGYPLAAYNRYCFWEGEIPLWNPYNSCGIPYLAQWNTIFLYPPSLFYMIFPTQWSLGIFCLFHLYFAGLGMYLLAKHWVSNNFAASIAGLGFAFSGLIQYSLMWPNDVSTFAWMPWVVLSVEKGLMKGGRLLAGAIVISAMQVLSGFPEGIILTWFIIAVLLLFVWLPQWIHQGGNGCNYELIKRFVFRFCVIIVSVAAMTLIQIAPFFDLLIHSNRSPDYGGSFWSMPWFGWANLILPLFYTLPASDGVFHQYTQQWTGSYYPGIIVFVFAMVALYKIRSRIVAVLAILLAFSLVMAIGDDGYLYKWIRTGFPFLGFMRFPVKLVTISTFVFPLLAAYSIGYLLKKDSSKILKSVFGFAVAVIILIGFLCLIEFKYPKPFDKPTTVLENGVTRIVLLIITLFFLTELLRSKKPKRFIPWLVVIFFWADLAFHSPRMNPVVNRSVYNPGNHSIPSDKLPAIGRSRAMIDPAVNKLMGCFTNPTNTFIEPTLRNMILYDNSNLIDRIPKIDGMYSLYPSSITDLIQMIYFWGEKVNIPDDCLNFLSVSWLVSTNLNWQYRSNALPWITAGQKPIYVDMSKSKMDALLLFNLGFDKVVFLPHNGEKYDIETAVKVDVKINRFLPHLIEFETSSEHSAPVVISQTFYHNWKAFVNGRETPIQRANAGFTSVKAPAGKNKFVLKYEDAFFVGGLFVSMLGLAVLFLIYKRIGGLKYIRYLR